jgi:hypothetical protein
MNDPTAQPNPATPAEPPPPERIIVNSRAAFMEAVDRLFATAEKQICLFDYDAGYFGLNSPKREEQLNQFLRKRRTNKLRVVVHDVRVLERDTPRLRRLQALFSHGIELHQTGEEIRKLEDVLLVGDSSHYLRRPSYEQAAGVAVFNDAAATRDWAQRFEEIWVQSVPAVGATTLGL